MPDTNFNRIMIGIPCYGSAPAETLEDYMRFAFYLGRHVRDYLFFISTIPKQEQFRARNAIVQATAQISAKYLLMLDDDQIINPEQTIFPTANYDCIQKMIAHMEKDPSIGIVGALYFQRGGSYHPVAMKEKHNEFFWLTEDDLTGGLQEVAVTGGGAMLINMAIIDKIGSPWFEPEQKTDGPSNGTDIQICRKARAAGYKVMLDSSIEFGHVKNSREVVTRKTRLKYLTDQTRITDSAQQEWDSAGMMTLFSMDVETYTGMSTAELEALAEEYPEYARINIRDNLSAGSDLREYYRGSGDMQLARQYAFHRKTSYGTHRWLSALRDMTGKNERYGLDFGCGSAPLGFQLLLDGNRMDFVDVDGAGGYEFTKWRAKHRNKQDRCGFTLAGPYDFILLMDIIEHLPDWEEVLTDLIGRLKPGGILATNYFVLTDHDNPEHISMNRKAVKRLLITLDMLPGNQLFWRKDNDGTGSYGHQPEIGSASAGAEARA